MFKAGDLSFKGKPIPIIRIDINKSKDIAEREKLVFKAVPKLVLYNHDEKYYSYDDNFNLPFLLHFINRHLYPIVLLKTRDQIDDFIDVNKEWTENTPFYTKKYYQLREIFPKMHKTTRVVAFANEKEYLADLKYNALKLAIRDDLRIGKVTNKELVEYYKYKLGSEAFDEYSSNSLVMFKRTSLNKPKVTYFDLSSETSSYFDWINENSLEPLEKLTGDSYKIADLMKKPMFITFLDREHSKYGKKSIELYDILSNKIAPAYPQYIFMYTEDTKSDTKRRYLGITWNELPSMALNYMQGTGSVVYPHKRPFSVKNINAFLKAYENGELEENFAG